MLALFLPAAVDGAAGRKGFNAGSRVSDAVLFRARRDQFAFLAASPAGEVLTRFDSEGRHVGEDAVIFEPPAGSPTADVIAAAYDSRADSYLVVGVVGHDEQLIAEGASGDGSRRGLPTVVASYPSGGLQIVIRGFCSIRAGTTFC